MYTAPESDRLTPSPTDSPRVAQQMSPAPAIAMQPFFQDQFVNNPAAEPPLLRQRARRAADHGLLSPRAKTLPAARLRLSAGSWGPYQQSGVSGKLDLSYGQRVLGLQPPAVWHQAASAAEPACSQLLPRLGLSLPWRPAGAAEKLVPEEDDHWPALVSSAESPAYTTTLLSSKDKLQDESSTVAPTTGTGPWMEAPQVLKAIDSGTAADTRWCVKGDAFHLEAPAQMLRLL